MQKLSVPHLKHSVSSKSFPLKPVTETPQDSRIPQGFKVFADYGFFTDSSVFFLTPSIHGFNKDSRFPRILDSLRIHKFFFDSEGSRILKGFKVSADSGFIADSKLLFQNPRILDSCRILCNPRIHGFNKNYV